MSYATRGGENNFRTPPSAEIKPTRLRSRADEGLAPDPGRFMKAGSHRYCLSEAAARCKPLHAVSARIDASKLGVDPARQFVATHLNAANDVERPFRITTVEVAVGGIPVLRGRNAAPVVAWQGGTESPDEKLSPLAILMRL